MPPPTGSEPDTGRRPISFQDSTDFISHNMYRAGSIEESWKLRALGSGFCFFGQRPVSDRLISIFLESYVSLLASGNGGLKVGELPVPP